MSEIDEVGIVDGKPRGEINRIAAPILMRILYAARIALLHILRVTCRMATRISRWATQDDTRLLRLIRYIHHHLDDRQVGFIGDEVKDTSLRLFCDADFAVDVASGRSIGGLPLVLHGAQSIYHLQCLSAKQNAIAFSAPEAEFYAGCM